MFGPEGGETGPTVQTPRHSPSRGYHTICSIVSTEKEFKAKPHQSRLAKLTPAVLWWCNQPGARVRAQVKGQAGKEGRLPSLVSWFTH